MRHGPRNLRVAADGVGLTQFGGVALIEQFFQRIQLQGALWRHVRFAQRNNCYRVSESLQALLYPLVLGLGPPPAGIWMSIASGFVTPLRMTGLLKTTSRSILSAVLPQLIWSLGLA
jgi:hypothetical protein